MTGSQLALVCIVVAISVLIPLMLWIVRSAKSRAGSFLVASSLFFSFGRMLEGSHDIIQVTKDPERKKRIENGDPPVTGIERG